MAGKVCRDCFMQKVIFELKLIWTLSNSAEFHKLGEYSLGWCSHIMSASCPGNKPPRGCQSVSLCHGSAVEHCHIIFIHCRHFILKWLRLWQVIDCVLSCLQALQRILTRNEDCGLCGIRRLLLHSQYLQPPMTLSTCIKHVSIVLRQRGKNPNLSINVTEGRPQSQQISTLKKNPTQFWLSHAVLILLTSKHPSLITPLLLSSPSLSLSGCLYLSSHPPWCFSPSLQSMWLLRCLSICSPRQAQRAGATLWLLGQ